MMEKKAALFRRQWLSLLCGALLWFTAFSLGWFNAPEHSTEITRVQQEPDWDLFLEILMRNIGVSGALFLGVVTAGVATIPVAMVTGALAGYSFGQAVPVLGVTGVTRHLLPHMPLELVSIAIAVGAGLVPLAAWARSGLGRRLSGAEWWSQVVDACRLWAVSLSGLVIAAGVETWVST
ncbi:stage II sporulation protein M [Streptomyces sp.]|uniref:stage II sporulation protein M n=1 Tax=Streptomyces sp. TaxID=1931 RepID=UPI002D7795DA|nr:stage II sporulation protein M [Streptomyces sp.]HET6357591.1 stage II sporulation protein M [Streptomyces sp.]